MSELGRSDTALLPMPQRLRARLDEWRQISTPFVMDVITNGLRIMPLATPRPAPPQPMSAALQPELQKMIDLGVVELTTESGLISPVVGITKKDGGIRFVQDLRRLNEVVPSTRFRMEGLETVRQLLPRGAYMGRLDLKNAYWHVPIHVDSRRLLQFRALGGKYQFCSLPFGIAIAPRTFTKVMRGVVGELRSTGVSCVIMLDDLLVWGRTQPEAELSVRAAMSLLERLGLEINIEKSAVRPCQQQRFLGVDIDSSTLTWSPTSDRLSSLLAEIRRVLSRARRGISPPVPCVRRLIGLLGYLRYGVVNAKAHQAHLMTCLRLALRRVGHGNFAAHRTAAMMIKMKQNKFCKPYALSRELNFLK